MQSPKLFITPLPVILTGLCFVYLFTLSSGGIPTVFENSGKLQQHPSSHYLGKPFNSKFNNKHKQFRIHKHARPHSPSTSAERVTTTEHNTTGYGSLVISWTLDADGWGSNTQCTHQQFNSRRFLSEHKLSPDVVDTVRLRMTSGDRVLCGHKNLTACTGSRSPWTLWELEQKSFFTVHRTAGKQTLYTDTLYTGTQPGGVSTGLVVFVVVVAPLVVVVDGNSLEAQGLSVFRGCHTTLNNGRWLLPLARFDVDSLQPKHQCRFTDWKGKYVRSSRATRDGNMGSGTGPDLFDRSLKD